MSPFPLDTFLASLPWTALAVLMVLGVTFAVAVAQSRHSVMDVGAGIRRRRGRFLRNVGRGRR